MQEFGVVNNQVFLILGVSYTNVVTWKIYQATYLVIWVFMNVSHQSPHQNKQIKTSNSNFTPRSSSLLLHHLEIDVYLSSPPDSWAILFW